MLRLFVGLAIPEDVREQSARLCHGIDGARWVGPDNMHVTLRFIGEVDEGVAEDIHAVLSKITVPSFEMALDGLGTFESRRGVRAVWSGVTPHDPLAALAAKIDTALVHAGLEPERRKFKPHMTLARFKNMPQHRIENWLQENAAFSTKPFLTDRYIMYRSHLTKDGAHYEDLASYPLSVGEHQVG